MNNAGIIDVMTYDEAHYFDIGTSQTPNIVLVPLK